LAVNYMEYIRRVEDRAGGGLDQEGAELAIRATLATLAERISAKEASDLAAQLPKEFKPALRRRGAGPGTFDIDEFVRRVADREELTPSEAFDHVRAVTNVLAEAVTGHELEDVRATLPDEFATLFQPPAAVNWPDAHAHRPHP
jgi:uncharacterized protein (DUF2267 family)